MEQVINKKVTIDISKEDFEAYEEVRASGVTNMFDVRYVCELSGLSRDKVIAVMEGYEKLMELYPDVRQN